MPRDLPPEKAPKCLACGTLQMRVVDKPGQFKCPNCGGVMIGGSTVVGAGPELSEKVARTARIAELERENRELRSKVARAENQLDFHLQQSDAIGDSMRKLVEDHSIPIEECELYVSAIDRELDRLRGQAYIAEAAAARTVDDLDMWRSEAEAMRKIAGEYLEQLTHLTRELGAGAPSSIDAKKARIMSAAGNAASVPLVQYSEEP